MRIKTAVTAIVCLTSVAFGQGSLTPPGAPAPTMKTLDELDSAIAGVSNAVSEIQDEARTPISSAGYTISSSGSYYLTADLIPVAGGSGITISTNDVTLDLNGFSILGAGANGQGIYMNNCDNVVVKNGTIRDCYYYGIAAFGTQRCRFENLRVLGNGRASSVYDGIHAGTNITIAGCTVMGNSSGIEVGAESKIIGNQIIDNTHDGLRLDAAGNYIADNIVKGNGDNYDLAAGNQLNILLCEVPETLARPCSVKLAGTLTCSQTGVNGISVNADDVSIDLDGHSLVGPGASSGHGIYQAASRRNLTVKNGKILEWRGSGGTGICVYGKSSRILDIQAMTNSFGIYLSNGDCTISDCVAENNGKEGIHAGAGSTVSSCVARNNGEYGIYISSGSTVSDCVVRDNGINGINTDYGCTVNDCVAYNNESDGIQTGNGSTISGCTASYNGEYGIDARKGNTVSGCTVSYNGTDGISTSYGSTISGCAASYNTGDGIEVNYDSRVVDNVCDNNGYLSDGAGIHVIGSDNQIDGNNVTDNDRGIDVDFAGSFIVRNIASGNSTNWTVAAGNACLVVHRTYGAAISGNSGGTAPGSTDPNANFTY